jgi:hypothetical protein
MTPAEIGGILLVLGGLAFAFGRFPSIRAVALFVGAILVGTTGHVAHWTIVICTWLSGVTSSVFAWGFGVAVPALFAIILIWLFGHGVHPKNRASRLTSIAGLALGFMVAAGITNISLLNQVGPGVQSTTTTVTGG